MSHCVSHSLSVASRPVVARAQRGFSLIELLIAMTIGLVILTAIGSAFSIATELSRQRDASSEIFEANFTGLQSIRRDIQNAGYVDIVDKKTQTEPDRNAVALFPTGEGENNHFVRAPFITRADGSTLSLTVTSPLQKIFPNALPIFGCDGAMNSSPQVLASTASAQPTCGATNSLSHSIQIVYQNAAAEDKADLTLRKTDNNLSGDGADCLMQGLPDASSSFTATAEGMLFAINRYDLRADASDNVRNLNCQGSNNTIAQPIARGVQELTFRYLQAATGVLGTNTNAVSSGAVASGSFLSAAQVAASTLGWPGVIGVEVCMAIASTPNANNSSGQTNASQPTRPTCARNANGSFAADVARVVGDNRVWRRYTSQIAVRNAIFTPVN
jgi:type IV pilus assembly protein PilW